MVCLTHPTPGAYHHVPVIVSRMGPVTPRSCMVITRSTRTARYAPAGTLISSHPTTRFTDRDRSLMISWVQVSPRTTDLERAVIHAPLPFRVTPLRRSPVSDTDHSVTG